MPDVRVKDKKLPEAKSEPKAAEKKASAVMPDVKPADKKDKKHDKPVRTDDGDELAIEIMESIPESEKTKFRDTAESDLLRSKKKADVSPAPVKLDKLAEKKSEEGKKADSKQEQSSKDHRDKKTETVRLEEEFVVKASESAKPEKADDKKPEEKKSEVP